MNKYNNIKAFVAFFLCYPMDTTNLKSGAMISMLFKKQTNSIY